MALQVTIPVERVDESFRALGSTVRIAVAAPGARGLLARARAELRAFERCASRFLPDSELCALNADPRPVVPASQQLREAVRAALWAADRSGGLVDPCLLDELEAAGYDRSLSAARGSAPSGWIGAAGHDFSLSGARGSAPSGWIGAAGHDFSSSGAPGPAPSGWIGAAGHDFSSSGARGSALGGSLGVGGPIRPARPHPAARWRDVRVDDLRGTIARPPGLRLDLGGSGKGHAADRVAGLLGSAREWVVDAGGDVRVGGSREVVVAHPLHDEPAARLQLTDGAVATSSIVRRSWRTAGGGAAHHLLDPATGRPAWTGLLSVTALAPTTLHAETLAKAALLSGPDGSRRILARHGGVAIHHDGEVEPA